MSKNCTFNHIFTLSDYMSLQEISPLKFGGKNSIIRNKILFIKRNNSFRKECNLNSLRLFLPSLLNTRNNPCEKGERKMHSLPSPYVHFYYFKLLPKVTMYYLISFVQCWIFKSYKHGNVELIHFFQTLSHKWYYVCVCVCFFSLFQFVTLAFVCNVSCKKMWCIV